MQKLKKEKVCFVGGALQANYIKQFNDKIDSLPEDFDLPYYVYTDSPEDITKSYDKLKVFSLTDLKKRTPETAKYEFVEGSTKLYSYPQNTRRDIINKAVEDGYECIIWNDCDAKLVAKQSNLLDTLSNLKVNNIYTQGSIYRNLPNTHGNKAPFYNCKKVINELNLKASEESLNIHDGPVCLYYFDSDTFSKYIEMWDKVTEYAYKTVYAHKGGHERPSVEVYAIAAAQVGVQHLNRQMFKIQHDLSIQY